MTTKISCAASFLDEVPLTMMIVIMDAGARAAGRRKFGYFLYGSFAPDAHKLTPVRRAAKKSRCLFLRISDDDGARRGCCCQRLLSRLTQKMNPLQMALGAAAPREGEATMSGRQRLAGSRQAARRTLPAANENDTAARHTTRIKPDGKESPAASLKNQSVIRAFAILKSFYHPDEWVAACELSRRAKIHEATVNRFMQSLVDVGAVVRDEDGRYRCVLFVMPGAQNGAFVNRRENPRGGPEPLSTN